MFFSWLFDSGGPSGISSSVAAAIGSLKPRLPLSLNISPRMHPAALAIIKYWPMSQTALHLGLASADAQIGSYNGVETALNFGSAARELAALRNGCGLFALPWRVQINVTGKDRVR